LDVNCRALQHALKARRRLCVVTVGGAEVRELMIDIVQNLAAQPIKVHAAGVQHGDRVLILGQRQQQMFERGIFVPALIGAGESPMQRLFEIA
jgi:NADPH-dependent ferric siderophore reductase